MFASEARGEILQRVCQNASAFIGIHIDKRGSMTMDQFQTRKFGAFGGDLHLTSISEFMVYKRSPRRDPNDPVRRTLCLSETCLVERDPATYSIASLRPLKTIAAIIRHPSDQMVSFQYVTGEMRTFTSTDR